MPRDIEVVENDRNVSVLRFTFAGENTGDPDVVIDVPVSDFGFAAEAERIIEERISAGEIAGPDALTALRTDIDANKTASDNNAMLARTNAGNITSLEGRTSTQGTELANLTDDIEERVKPSSNTKHTQHCLLYTSPSPRDS